MNTHANKSQESNDHVVLNEVAQKQHASLTATQGSETFFHLADNRQEAVMQRKLQKMAINSPQSQQALQLQVVANSQTKNPIQKQGIEEEELLQGKFKPIQKQSLEEEELLQGKFKPVQKKELEEEELLQGKFQTVQKQGMEEELLQGNFDPVQKQENDTGMPNNLKSGIENLSGYSMDDVQVHYNSGKPEGLQAHAYAQGTDIHLAPGQEKHLPHEAWHVVQQKQGRVKPTMQLQDKVNVNDDKGLEKEADVMGEKAMQMTFTPQDNIHSISTKTAFSQFVSQKNMFQRKTGVTIQRILSKDQPIHAADVASVSNPHGNVYILTGHAGDSVVVKFEIAGAEGPAKYKARYRLAEELGKEMLSGALDKPEITKADIAEMKTIPAGLGQSSALVQVLNQGIDQAGVGIKMDEIAMGENLFDMAANNAGGAHTAALSNILTVKKCIRYGEMAYFDVLTRNFDRFREDGTMAAKNIDYDVTNAEAIPLDNIYFSSGLTGSNWQQELNEMKSVSSAKRMAYAQTAVAELISESGLPAHTFSTMQIGIAVASFKRGMGLAYQKAWQTISQWKRTQTALMGRGRNSQDTIDAKAVLVARYDLSA